MKKLKSVLVIGSGPIVIGQAAEFDYSGTQACLALKEEGVTSIVVNPNPATIQTDKEIADKVYLEPLTVESLAEIIKKEKPDGLIATVGGQTALNLATNLSKEGILKRYNVQVLGTDILSITLGEDRNKFAQKMKEIHQPVLPSLAVKTYLKASLFVKRIGFPVIIRSAYTLGGKGSSVAYNKNDFEEKVKNGLKMSPIGQVLIEKSVLGWGEFEYEMVRDSFGNSISVCSMENLNPMGVHTGESIVVAPVQTISDDNHQMLRSAAFKIIEALNIKGSCNVQFALNQHTGEYYVIEVNPRLSRSSALASKATGYPIAKVATKIALGYTLPEIRNEITGKTAFFEPSLDYLVIKIPRWPFDKFPALNQELGISMKSTGEVMAIARSFEEALQKAIDSLDMKEDIFISNKSLSRTKILEKLKLPTGGQLGLIIAAVKKGISVQQIHTTTGIHLWFLTKICKLVIEKNHKKEKKVFKMFDTCSGEFAALTPYFYSTYGEENEAGSLVGPKVIILGSGPIRIGQGIEFDYMTVHTVKALKAAGIKSIIVNNNPETVSTDYSISDRLYFEPLTIEYVKHILKNEKKGLLGVITQFGGQTALNLTSEIEKLGVKVLGTSEHSIMEAEDRAVCSNELSRIGLNVPKWTSAKSKEEVLDKCLEIGFPLLLRPSYVLAGEGMIIAKNKKDVENYLSIVPENVFDNPLLIDQFIDNAKELDIDFISDSVNTKAFILEQVEPTGVHSGDSICIFPAQSLSKKLVYELEEITDTIAKKFGIIGLGNIQVAIHANKIFILEINPRASRTIPFLSKALGISLVSEAIKVLLGNPLSKESLHTIPNGLIFTKKPVFSFDKLSDLDTTLGPVMKSTGEIMTATEGISV